MTEITEWNDAIPYTKFIASARENVELMKARYSDLLINEADEQKLKSLQNEIKILVIGSDRCNDTAGNLPVLARMASLSSKVELRFLDADKYTNLHQQFKVNDKRKTPVVLFLSSELFELVRWIERTNMVYKLINEKNLTPDERRTELRKVYSDPEILRQSLHTLTELLLRADFILGRK